ncbi:uncharacterized protein LOC119090941 [Pollicipes pollicipes]|nr:uncharacterized protein LOC119090941 [Pollicipes pollicipes]
MSHRSRHLYGAVLGAIGRRLRLAPATFLAGWEDGLQAAAQTIWPQARVSGGWFHYAKAVLDQIRRVGLVAEYKQPATDFGKWARELLTVPLVPADRLEDVWALLLDREAPETAPELRPQVDLLRRYMQEWRQLEAERLCVHGQPRRVSDYAKDVVAALASKFSSAHPNFWLFVEKTNLAINDANRHGEAAQLRQLTEVRSLRDNRQQLQAKLASLIKGLEEGLPLEKYIGAVIHLFRRRIAALETEEPDG